MILNIQMRTVAMLSVVGLSMVGASAMAMQNDFQWALRVNEGRVSDAILAYEVPDTDMQPLSMTCEEGGQRIFVNVSGGPKDLRSIGLKAGGVSKILTGQSEFHDDVGEAHFTSTEISSADPLIATFAQSGWLTIQFKGAERVLDGGSQGRGAVQRFVRFCHG